MDLTRLLKLGAIHVNSYSSSNYTKAHGTINIQLNISKLQNKPLSHYCYFISMRLHRRERTQYPCIEGVVQVIPIAANCTADIIIASIENQILLLLPRNVFLVADNASVHNEQRLCNSTSKKHLHLLVN